MRVDSLIWRIASADNDGRAEKRSPTVGGPLIFRETEAVTPMRTRRDFP